MTCGSGSTHQWTPAKTSTSLRAGTGERLRGKKSQRTQQATLCRFVFIHSLQYLFIIEMSTALESLCVHILNRASWLKTVRVCYDDLP